MNRIPGNPITTAPDEQKAAALRAARWRQAGYDWRTIVKRLKHNRRSLLEWAAQFGIALPTKRQPSKP